MKTVFNDGSPIWLKVISGLLLAFLLFFTVNSFGGIVFSNDYESELKAAKAAYEKALAGHCSIIGAKTKDCYEGGDCAALESSIQWFMSGDGYGEPPEVICRDRARFR